VAVVRDIMAEQPLRLSLELLIQAVVVAVAVVKQAV